MATYPKRANLVIFTFVFVLTAPFVFCVDKLVAVNVLFRHGDRPPMQPYPNDPYKDPKYWPVGFGQLTNKGKQEQFALGEWLRARYVSFLPSNYSENDIYVRSSDVDRTLASAEANLAGLYPPKDRQIWNTKIPWQPIPVHTSPEVEDAVLAMKKPCLKYDQLQKELFKSDYFLNISQVNHDLYAYLTRYSGSVVSSLVTLEYLFNTLYIETLYNYSLPNWTAPVFPAKMQKWAEMSFTTDCFTPELARLKAGPLFHDFLANFKAIINGDGGVKKMWMYSGHDTTIANVLNSLGAFINHCPSYASTILIELRLSDELGYYVNVFYRNANVLEKIVVNGCDFNCRISDFYEILAPIVVDLDEWERECNSGWVYYNSHFLSKQFLAVLFLIAIIIVLSGWMIVRICKRGARDTGDEYMKLPNDEVA